MRAVLRAVRAASRRAVIPKALGAPAQTPHNIPTGWKGVFLSLTSFARFASADGAADGLLVKCRAHGEGNHNAESLVHINE